jgi:hypothetical protein
MELMMMSTMFALAAMSGLALPSIAETAPAPLRPDAAAAAVIDFWRQAGPALWFAKD